MRRVRQIEKLRAEFQLLAFGDGKLLEDREVVVAQPRPAHRVAARRAITRGRRGGRGKGRRVKPRGADADLMRGWGRVSRRRRTGDRRPPRLRAGARHQGRAETVP